MRFGIVGTGFIANVIAKTIAESAAADLAAVASRRRESGLAFAEPFGKIKVFDSWRELAAWEGIDAVYVATPTQVREQICLAAAENNKHVLADKPFSDAASLRRITSACRDHGVAFMDATHFVHHPRTKRLKRDMANTVGEVRLVRSAFFFPSMNRDNIRFNPALEPTGALGDMAWYSMRAVVEFLQTGTSVCRVDAHVHRDTLTGSVIRAAGLLVFEDGTTSTWDVGYDVGCCLMNLEILGSEGVIELDDFVLDWAKGFAFDNPDHRVGYTLRTGMATPAQFRFIETSSGKSQQVLMIEDFVELCQNPATGDLREASVVASERTQSLLDAIWNKIC